MKRLLCLAAALLLAGGVLAGCSRMAAPESEAAAQTTTTAVSAMDKQAVKEAFRAYLTELYPYPDSLWLEEARLDGIQLLGMSNGWTICQYTAPIITNATILFTLDGYTFYKNNGPLGLYAVKGNTVLLLQEAYDQQLINVAEVYRMVPAFMQRGEPTARPSG